jgi:Pyruvate/2-oxoacid:ferredoxin oxidoreductase delta subunit
MRANAREIEQAIEEGVTIHAHRGIVRLILRGERAVGVEMVHMKKLPDANGTLKRVAFEGTETVLHVDQVIPAIGQVVQPAGLEALLNGESFFNIDGWCRIQGYTGIFTGGDACAGRGTVAAAVGDGRRAAQAIADTIEGKSLPQQTSISVLPFEQLNVSYYELAPRHHQPVLPVEQRKGEEEIERGLNDAQVSAEAKRCFSCGNCMACDNCWTLCPDNAVLKTKEIASDGSHYVFDYDYCKGCGLCANECPCGYIVMQEEA